MIGIVLAGGRATRMGGGDKGALRLGATTVIERVVDALRAQCENVLVAGPADLPVRADACVPDAMPGQPGPLAGVLGALDHVAQHYPASPFVVTAPTDTPFLPYDLVARFQDKRVADRALVVCARSRERTHHVVALWSVALRDDLRRALVHEDVRKVGDFLARHPVAYVTWPSEPYDPFLNINTPEDLAAAAAIAEVVDGAGQATRDAGPGGAGGI